MLNLYMIILIELDAGMGYDEDLSKRKRWRLEALLAISLMMARGRKKSSSRVEELDDEIESKRSEGADGIIVTKVRGSLRRLKEL